MSDTTQTRRDGHGALRANGNGGLTTYDPHPESNPKTSESHAVVRETTYDRGIDIDYLLGLFRNQGKTGTLRIDISQGTVNAVRFEERQKLP